MKCAVSSPVEILLKSTFLRNKSHIVCLHINENSKAIHLAISKKGNINTRVNRASVYHHKGALH